MTLHETYKASVSEFEKKFGKASSEDLKSPSIGASAGCDDCICNQKEREEHKQFLKSHTLAMIQGEIDRLNIIKLECLAHPLQIAEKGSNWINKMDNFNTGIDKTLDENIAYLTEQYQLIEKE